MAKKTSKKTTAVISPERFMRDKVRTLPLGKCFISSDWKDSGVARVIVSRIRPGGNLTVGSFLVDTLCLGVTEAKLYINISPEQLDEIITPAALQEISYPEAHNLIYGAVEFAKEGGLLPPKEFGLVRYVLDEDTDAIPLIDYEFGRSGKHHLSIDRLSDAEAARCLRLLRSTLGDDFTIARSTDTVSSIPKEAYTYRHPGYPTKPSVSNRFITDELLSPDNFAALPDDVVSRILTLPPDEAATDLAQIILYEIGRTYRAIADGTADAPDNSAIFHALLLLTQIDSDRSLDAILQLMCQSDEFIDFHLADYATYLLHTALYAAGRHHIPDIESYIRKPGLNSYVRSQAARTFVMIALRHPERRDEIISVLRRWLEWIATTIASCRGCDGNLAGFIMPCLIDLNAAELLPQIKAVFDTGCVNDSIAGDYDSVATCISQSDSAPTDNSYQLPDIAATYRSLREAADKQLDTSTIDDISSPLI